LQLVSILLFALVGGEVPAAKAAQFSPRQATSCADQALDTFVRDFWDPAKTTFYEGFNAGTCTYAGADYWLSAEALHALIDSYARTKREDILTIIDQYFRHHDSKGWLQYGPGKFYDDEEWMALALVRATEVTGDSKFLEGAKVLNEDIKKQGWDSKCCGAHPGGIWWNGYHTQKSTVSNAVAVVESARLGLLTHNRSDIEFAKKVYDYWIEQAAFEPFNNPHFLQIADHINTDGTKVLGLLTYDEGMMVGAGVALYQATQEPKYLEDARKFANYTLDQATTQTPLGKILTDHAATDLPSCRFARIFEVGDPAFLARHKDFPLFKYTTFRSFIELAKELPAGDPQQRSLIRFLSDNAQAICEIARDPVSGLFSVNWEQRDPDSVTGSLISPMTAALGSLSVFTELQNSSERF
jgi:predicted alpha-1,6-mannanase (GH76 family)